MYSRKCLKCGAVVTCSKDGIIAPHECNDSTGHDIVAEINKETENFFQVKFGKLYEEIPVESAIFVHDLNNDEPHIMTLLKFLLRINHPSVDFLQIYKNAFYEMPKFIVERFCQSHGLNNVLVDKEIEKNLKKNIRSLFTSCFFYRNYPVPSQYNKGTFLYFKNLIEYNEKININVKQINHVHGLNKNKPTKAIVPVYQLIQEFNKDNIYIEIKILPNETKNFDLSIDFQVNEDLANNQFKKLEEYLNKQIKKPVIKYKKNILTQKEIWETNQFLSSFIKDKINHLIFEKDKNYNILYYTSYQNYINTKRANFSITLMLFEIAKNIVSVKKIRRYKEWRIFIQKIRVLDKKRFNDLLYNDHAKKIINNELRNTKKVLLSN